MYWDFLPGTHLRRQSSLLLKLMCVQSIWSSCHTADCAQFVCVWPSFSEHCKWHYADCTLWTGGVFTFRTVLRWWRPKDHSTCSEESVRDCSGRSRDGFLEQRPPTPQDKVSLCCPGCPETPFVDHTSFEPRHLHLWIPNAPPCSTSKSDFGPLILTEQSVFEASLGILVTWFLISQDTWQQNQNKNKRTKQTR